MPVTFYSDGKKVPPPASLPGRAAVVSGYNGALNDGPSLSGKRAGEGIERSTVNDAEIESALRQPTSFVPAPLNTRYGTS
ncbi:MAG: hypothetical protein JW913_08085 [Chitinispirillaceae bacterium]|nr:hypothetical protein [Chitinispirillaceae bacterium]